MSTYKRMTLVGLVLAASLSSLACDQPAPPTPIADGQGKNRTVKRGGSAHESGPTTFIKSANGVHALLVGVTKYDHLPKTRHLAGPGNDVVLIRKLLMEKFLFPSENIITLSEAQGKSLRPNRANIQRAVQSLIRVVRAGERVVILLSGHGSWQPDDDPNNPDDLEEDGRDEVFCPADVTRLRADDQGKIANAISDDELREWLGALVRKRALVWLIADACHSGTLGRGGEHDVARSIEPYDLLPESERPKGNDTQVVPRGVDGEFRDFEKKIVGRGKLWALYAAQPYQETYEARFPLGDATGTPHGILSYTLCQVLNQMETPITHRELLQRIHARYIHRGRTHPTPLLESTEPDQFVLEKEVVPGRSRVTLRSLEDGNYAINAGAMHDITENSVLAVYPAAGQQDDDQPVSHVRVVRVRALDSVVQPCQFGRSPPRRDLPKENRCELVHVDYGSRQVSIAVDTRAQKGESVPAARLAQLRQTLRGLEDRSDSLVRIVQDPLAADWLLRVHGKNLLLVSSDTRRSRSDLDDLNRVSSIFGETDGRVATWLEIQLTRIHRATNLVRLASSPLEGRFRSQKTVKIDVEMLRFAEKSDSEGMPVRWRGDGLTLHPGDLIGFRVTNRSRVTVDVSLLFIDSRFGISQFFPEPGTAGNRLKPGTSFVTNKGRISDKTFGLEHLAVIAVNAKPETAPIEFTFLQQPGCDEQQRSEAEDLIPRDPKWDFPLASLLVHVKDAQLGTGGMTRGAVNEHALMLFSWRTLPRRIGSLSKKLQLGARETRCLGRFSTGPSPKRESHE